MKTNIVHVVLCAALCCAAVSPAIAEPEEAESPAIFEPEETASPESVAAARKDEAAARKVALDAVVARTVYIAPWPVPKDAITYMATVGDAQCTVRVVASSSAGTRRWNTKELECRSESKTAARLDEAAARKAALDTITARTIHIAPWAVGADMIAYSAKVGDKECTVIVSADASSGTRLWKVDRLECKP